MHHSNTETTVTKSPSPVARAGALIFALVVATAAQPAAADEPPFVRIGSLDWMTRNVDVATFRNGDPIPVIEDANAWALAGVEGNPAMAFYGNDASKLPVWGRLYNHHAVMDPRGLCPDGWRVPTDADWLDLENTLGRDKAALRLRARTGWPPNGAGIDDVGFAGLPAGFRTQTGDFFLADRVAYFWSATSVSPKETIAHMLFDYDAMLFRIVYQKAKGMSLRCVRYRQG